jgi:ribosomal RNA-processing protein 36
MVTITEITNNSDNDEENNDTEGEDDEFSSSVEDTVQCSNRKSRNDKIHPHFKRFQETSGPSDEDDESDRDEDDDDDDDDDISEEGDEESLRDDSDENSEFENDNDNDNDDGEKIKADDDEIRNLPLGERLRRQMEQGSNSNINWKEIRKDKHMNSMKQIQNVELNSDMTKNTKKKKSKHAPTEMSSKRKDFYFRQKLDIHSGGCSSIGTSINVHSNIYKPRDPRSTVTESNSNAMTKQQQQQRNTSRGGKKLLQTLKERNDHQIEDYAFLQEMRNNEIQTLQKKIKAYQMTGRKGQEHRKRYNCNTSNDGLVEDQKLLHQLLQEKSNYERKQLDIDTKRIVQETIHKKRKRDSNDSNTILDDDHNNHSSSTKYVPKVRDLKRIYMETKYDLLQQQKGGQHKIDKMIYKKHLKNKSKDAKYM